jgi:hypothetical protein
LRNLAALLLVGLLEGCGPDEPWNLAAIEDAQSPSAAWLVEEDPDAQVRRESFLFGGGAGTSVSDYLFVVDNSISMRKIIGDFRSGFAGLASVDNPFPEKARIAVMSTLPARLDDLERLNPAVQRGRALHRDPGFLRLVDRRGIQVYRRMANEDVAKRFSADGCEAWFGPTDLNEGGIPCIVAHTQIGLTAVDAESGLTALFQMLQKHQGSALFRRGAAVNVIFVSDTHDPGLSRVRTRSEIELEAWRPGYAELRALAERDNVLASFRLHAIAPATECVERWEHLGASYYQAATDSGGVTLDICTAKDYTAVIRAIAERGSIPQDPLFPLGKRVVDVLSVRVDGKPVNYSVLGDDVLRLDAMPIPEERVHLEVLYRYHTPPIHPAPDPDRTP